MKRPSSVMDVQGVSRLAIVCAWHDTKAEGDAWAEDRGYSVSHGLCVLCEAREFPFAAENRRAKAEGRAPVYVTGTHMLDNRRVYQVTDTGLPFIAEGGAEMGGYLVEGDGERMSFATSRAVAAFLEGAKGLPRAYGATCQAQS